MKYIFKGGIKIEHVLNKHTSYSKQTYIMVYTNIHHVLNKHTTYSKQAYNML